MTKSFDKLAYRKQKEEELKHMSKEAVRKVLNFENDPKKALEVLKFLSLANNYTFKNQMMIKSQYKGAQFVKGRMAFEKEMGLKVNGKEKPIKVIAPQFRNMIIRNNKKIPYKFATYEEKMRVKNKELKLYKEVHYYKLVDVFDITQTNAKPEDYPEYYPNKRQNFYAKDPEIIKDIIDSNIKYLNKQDIQVHENILNNKVIGAAQGVSMYNTTDNQVDVGLRAGLSETEKMATLLHETTHAIFHKSKKENIGQSMKELEAELTSYVVSNHFGLDTQEQAIKYVSDWLKKTVDSIDIEKSANRISDYSRQIINGIEKYIDDEKLVKFYENNDFIEDKNDYSYIKDTTQKIDSFVYKKWDKETIKSASEVSIVAVALSKGMEINEESKKFTTIDGIYTFYPKKNTYYNHQTQTSGNPIDFMVNEFNMKFPHAVNYLSDEKLPKKQGNKTEKNNYVTKEEVELATSKDILSVVSSCGYSFKPCGKFYKGIEHDSLILNPNKNSYGWYSKQEFGTTIDFIMRDKDLDFVNAVKLINNGDYSEAKVQEITKVKYELNKGFKEIKDMTKSFNYLTKDRKIDQQLVSDLITSGHIKEDKYNNVVFLWKNTQNQVVGSDKVGTSGKRFKGIDAGSDSRYGFSFKRGTPNDLYVFESAIDAMSYVSLNKNISGEFVSMNGLKRDTLLSNIVLFKEKYNKNSEKVYVGVDNDHPAKEFFESLPKLQFKDTEKDVKYNYLVPDEILGKDWNDVLKKKTMKIKPHLENEGLSI